MFNILVALLMGLHCYLSILKGEKVWSGLFFIMCALNVYAAIH